MYIYCQKSTIYKKVVLSDLALGGAPDISRSGQSDFIPTKSSKS